MQQRQLGPFKVSAIGLGCMNLSHAYGTPPSAEQGARVLLAALDAGVTLFDTAALYGFGANEKLLGHVFKAHRQRFTLASKGGMAGVQFADGVKRVIDDSPDARLRGCSAPGPHHRGDSNLNAVVKKSSVPKLPDFSVMCTPPAGVFA